LYLIISGVIVTALLLVFAIRAVLTPFLFALVITYLFAPLIEFLESRGLGRLLAILAVYAVFGAVVALVVVFLVPNLLAELNRFAESVPELIRRVEAFGERLERSFTRTPLPDSVRAVVNDTIRDLEQTLLNLARAAVQGTVSLFSGLLSLILAPILAFYLLRDLPAFKDKLTALVPKESRAEVLAVAVEVDRALAGFIRGQLILALVVGVLTALGLQLLGVRFALILGMVAGFFNIIPYFGPIVGAIPAVALALLKDPLLALWVVLMFFGIQQLENLVLSPKILGERVGLHPLAVIFSVLAGAQLGGVVGMFLAVPVMAVARVLIWYLIRKVRQ